MPIFPLASLITNAIDRFVFSQMLGSPLGVGPALSVSKDLAQPQTFIKRSQGPWSDRMAHPSADASDGLRGPAWEAIPNRAARLEARRFTGASLLVDKTNPKAVSDY